MKKIIVAFFSVVLLLMNNLNLNVLAVTLTDGGGNEFIINEVPERIVVLGYSEYDTLRFLGMEAQIVGAPKTKAPQYIGEIAPEITDIGSLKEPNLEVIAELNPDLIIATGRTASLIGELSEIAPVYLSQIDTKNYWQSFVEQNLNLAKIVDKEQVASTEIKALEALIANVKSKNDESVEKTLMLMINEGTITAFSETSRFGLIYQLLGFVPVDETIEESTHGQEISYEGIMSINPDIIFYVDRTAAIGGDSSVNTDFLNNELIKETKASQNKAILPLSSDLWYLAGGGLESFKLQVEEIAKLMEE